MVVPPAATAELRCSRAGESASSEVEAATWTGRVDGPLTCADAVDALSVGPRFAG